MKMGYRIVGVLEYWVLDTPEDYYSITPILQHSTSSKSSRGRQWSGAEHLLHERFYFRILWDC